MMSENDNFDGTNSQVSFVVPDNGQFTIIVTSYDAGETGRFELRVK